MTRAKPDLTPAIIVVTEDRHSVHFHGAERVLRRAVRRVGCKYQIDPRTKRLSVPREWRRRRGGVNVGRPEVARWRAQRRLSDAELLEAFRWWHDQRPAWDAPRWAQEQHIAGVRRWCEENDTNVLEMLRMLRASRG